MKLINYYGMMRKVKNKIQDLAIETYQNEWGWIGTYREIFDDILIDVTILSNFVIFLCVNNSGLTTAKNIHELGYILLSVFFVISWK